MGDKEAFHPHKSPKWNMYAFGAAILASMTSILMGYNIGVISGAGIYIEEDLGIDDTKLEIVSGIINLYSLVGSTIAGRMSDWIGRRFTIIFAAAIFFASSLITCLAPNYAVLMVGRFFGGVGVGYALVIAPVYAAEVAPASARGFLSSLPEIFINGGLLLGYLSNFAFSGLSTHLGWRVMFAVGAIPPIFLAAGVMFMPESPRWLVMQGRIEDARWVLDRTSDTSEEADFRLSEIQEAARLPTSTTTDDPSAPLLSGRRESFWRELFIPSPQVRRVLIAAIGLQFFQQATGVDSVVLYNPRVLAKAGISNENVILGATVAVGAVKTGFILVATFLCDRVGRRPLLLTSVGGMVVSLLVLSTGLLVIDQHPDANLPWLAVLCVAMVIAFVGSFAVGLGPIAWAVAEPRPAASGVETADQKPRPQVSGVNPYSIREKNCYSAEKNKKNSIPVGSIDPTGLYVAPPLCVGVYVGDIPVATEGARGEPGCGD